MSNGKGDTPRPMEVGYDEYVRRWAKAFQERAKQELPQGEVEDEQEQEQTQDQE